MSAAMRSRIAATLGRTLATSARPSVVLSGPAFESRSGRGSEAFQLPGRLGGEPKCCALCMSETAARRTHPIDELTRQILLEWLSYRSTRWPCTANPHLLVNQMSANGTGPVSTIYFATTGLRGQAATLERLRVDRQLQEALACGPDPLHLAAMFGLDPKTAIRYAENARMLLVTAAEQQDPA